MQEADLPPAFKTIAASMAAGLFRIVLMPVDALKTIMQVRGKIKAKGGRFLEPTGEGRVKVARNGKGPLFYSQVSSAQCKPGSSLLGVE